MKTLIEAARAVIHQRDFHAEFLRYDDSTRKPESDQCFDDWAADILQEALAIESECAEGN